MFRRSPRSVLLWLAAAVTAIATTASVAGSMSSLRRQDQAFGRLHTVVVAAHDLQLGATVQASDLSVRRVRGEAGAGPPLADPSDAVGRVIAFPLLRGAPVTHRHLAARGRRGPGAVVPPGRRAMRFVTEGGLEPAPGDVVDVFVTIDPDPAVTVAAGVTVIGADRLDAGRTGITVLLREEDAARLAYASAVGSLAVALAPPEAARTEAPDAS